MDLSVEQTEFPLLKCCVREGGFKVSPGKLRSLHHVNRHRASSIPWNSKRPNLSSSSLAKNSSWTVYPPVSTSTVLQATCKYYGRWVLVIWLGAGKVLASHPPPRSVAGVIQTELKQNGRDFTVGSRIRPESMSGAYFGEFLQPFPPSLAGSLLWNRVHSTRRRLASPNFSNRSAMEPLADGGSKPPPRSSCPNHYSCIRKRPKK